METYHTFYTQFGPIIASELQFCAPLFDYFSSLPLPLTLYLCFLICNVRPIASSRRGGTSRPEVAWRAYILALNNIFEAEISCVKSHLVIRKPVATRWQQRKTQLPLSRLPNEVFLRRLPRSSPAEVEYALGRNNAFCPYNLARRTGRDLTDRRLCVVLFRIVNAAWCRTERDRVFVWYRRCDGFMLSGTLCIRDAIWDICLCEEHSVPVAKWNRRHRGFCPCVRTRAYIIDLTM